VLSFQSEAQASGRINASALPCVRFEIITVVEENLIKVSVLYPNTAGCRFDMNYYLNRHMPDGAAEAWSRLQAHGG
jgi:hypothetical protein